MKNQFRGATPELLAIALFSKRAAKSKTRRKPRLKLKPGPRRRSAVQSSSHRRRCRSWTGLCLEWTPRRRTLPEWITFAAVVALFIAFFKAAHDFAYWRGEVDSDRKSFKAFMAEVRADMADIRQKLDSVLWQLPSTPVARSSPLQLTDLGEELAGELNASEWAAKLAPSMHEQVDDMLPWEIDDFCDHYVDTSLSEQMNRRVAE